MGLVPVAAPGRAKTSTLGLSLRGFDGGRRRIERPAAARQLLLIVRQHALGRIFRRKGYEAAVAAAVLGFELSPTVLRELAKYAHFTLATSARRRGDGLEGDHGDEGKYDGGRECSERYENGLAHQEWSLSAPARRPKSIMRDRTQ